MYLFFNHPNPSSSTLHSRTPLLSSLVHGARSSLLNYYAHLAFNLARDGHLHDFTMVAESVIASGIDVEQFVAALSLAPAASGISRNFCEGNVETIVEVLRRVEQFGGRIKAMAAYNVKLITPEGKKVITVPDDVYILDHAEEEGIDLPYLCRAGSCSSCVGKVVSGTVDQSDDSFLNNDRMADGWLLTCVAYPTSGVA